MGWVRFVLVSLLVSLSACAEPSDPGPPDAAVGGCGEGRLHTAAALPDGRVLIVGGYTYFQLSTTAIYLPCAE